MIAAVAGESIGFVGAQRWVLSTYLSCLLLVLFFIAPAASAATPANDGFSTAQQLGAVEDNLPGSTFGATKEPAEPDHAGDPGGASVWYMWTAPDFQQMFTRVCAEGWNALVGVYQGDSLGGLVRVASSSSLPGDSCRELRFRATAGVTYRIAVDGYSAGGTSEPEGGSFELDLHLIRLTGPPKTPTSPTAATLFEPPAFADTQPPSTYVRKLFRGRNGVVGFQLGASDSGSKFSCRIDRQQFAACASPKIYRHLPPGWHRFAVKATDTAGNIDGTPAIRRFRVSTQ
jgi:hypothetical protein